MHKQGYKSKKYVNNSGFLRTIYENECFMCEHQKTQIEIHHNDRNSFNHDLFNLVPLCLNCHKFIHKTSIIFPNVSKRHSLKLATFVLKYFEF
jgi:hypothetical protein